MERSSAAAVIIGNEVLSAKVQDANGPLLMRRLREHGLRLVSVEVVPDEIDAIVDALSRARAKARFLFTSGGIGPTHDDVTVRAVSLALGRPVVRLPQMEALVRGRSHGTVTAESLRLADAPEGAELWDQEGSDFPVLTVDNVFLLPGVPQLFRLQLETVLKRLEGKPLHLRNLYLRLGEGAIANALDRVALGMPQVAVGSYPEFDSAKDYRVKVTLEAGDGASLDEALARLKEALPPDAWVRLE